MHRKPRFQRKYTAMTPGHDTLFIHLVAVADYDYNERIGTHYAVTYSWDGETLMHSNRLDGEANGSRKAANAYIDSKVAEAHGCETLTVKRGKDVSRTVNHNPHGLI